MSLFSHKNTSFDLRPIIYQSHISCLCFESYAKHHGKTIPKDKIEMNVASWSVCRLNALAYIKQVQANSAFMKQ